MVARIDQYAEIVIGSSIRRKYRSGSKEADVNPAWPYTLSLGLKSFKVQSWVGKRVIFSIFLPE